MHPLPQVNSKFAGDSSGALAMAAIAKTITDKFRRYGADSDPVFRISQTVTDNIITELETFGNNLKQGFIFYDYFPCFSGKYALFLKK